nr:hypothetical protein [Pseudomonas sp.]
MRILYDNAADRATITVTDAAPTMGPEYLQTDDKGEACRILAPAGTITLAWVDPEAIAAVVLPASNLSASSIIRVQAYLAGQLVHDTGERDAAPGPMLANWGFRQRINMNQFGDMPPITAVYLPFVECDRIDILLEDPHRTYLDISRVVCGSYIEPQYGASYGAAPGILDMTTNSRSAAGSLRSDMGPRANTLTFDLGAIAERDRHLVMDVVRLGIGKNIFISLLPENADPLKEQAYMIYGKQSQSGAMAYVTYGLHQTSFQIDGW